MADETTATMVAEVYLICPDADELHRFGCWMAENWAGERDAPDVPEPHRRFFITTWAYNGDGEPWKGAYETGLGQAAGVMHGAREAGIDVALYAIRVQPFDAEFPAETRGAYELSGGAS